MGYFNSPLDSPWLEMWVKITLIFGGEGWTRLWPSQSAESLGILGLSMSFKGRVVQRWSIFVIIGWRDGSTGPDLWMYLYFHTEQRQKKQKKRSIIVVKHQTDRVIWRSRPGWYMDEISFVCNLKCLTLCFLLLFTRSAGFVEVELKEETLLAAWHRFKIWTLVVVLFHTSRSCPSFSAKCHNWQWFTIGDNNAFFSHAINHPKQYDIWHEKER